MIDTHCHLYLDDFADDREQMIERALKAGVSEFFLPAIDSSTHGAMLQLEEGYPDLCRSMIGLHPCSVKENFHDELGIIRSYLESRKFCGIGETGLDFYWDKTFMAQQYEALQQQAEWAIEFKTPLILHTREAMDETIDVISHYKGRGLKGIFHCFGGTMEQAEKIIELGFFLGIGGVITYKKSGLSELIGRLGPGNIVLETDSPYLTPVPFRGKRNESSYLSYIAGEVSRVCNMPVSMVDEITTANARVLFPEG